MSLCPMLPSLCGFARFYTGRAEYRYRGVGSTAVSCSLFPGFNINREIDNSDCRQSLQSDDVLGWNYFISGGSNLCNILASVILDAFLVSWRGVTQSPLGTLVH